MSRLRFVILCAMAGFVVMLGLMLWNAKNLPGFKRGALLNMLPANVDMRLGNLTLSETDGDGRTMAVKAQTAHYFKEEDYFLLTNVAADIDSEGAGYAVSAKTGRYEPKDKLVFLTGSVRASDSLGRVLTGGRMYLDLGKGSFSSLEAFCLENPDLSLSGQSFVYDAKTGRLAVEGRVFMLISRPPGAGPDQGADPAGADPAGADPS